MRRPLHTRHILLALCMFGSTALALGCSEDDENDPAPATGGDAGTGGGAGSGGGDTGGGTGGGGTGGGGTGGGGTGGDTTGGGAGEPAMAGMAGMAGEPVAMAGMAGMPMAGMAGMDMGGMAGMAMGGAAGMGMSGSAGMGTSGAAGAPAAFWTGSYNPAGAPSPADGQHQAGNECMSCHPTGSAQWLFGGTVYQSDGTTPAANVEVGVLSGGVLYSNYSATNGNFWVNDPGGVTINWAGSEVRIRNGNGEAAMVSAAQDDCNVCHTGGFALLEP